MPRLYFPAVNFVGIGFADLWDSLLVSDGQLALLTVGEFSLRRISSVKRRDRRLDRQHRERDGPRSVTREYMRGRSKVAVAWKIWALVLVTLIQLASAATSNPPSQDIGWPRQVSKNGATLIYYQPQLDKWKDYKELQGRMAFSLKPANGKQVLGVASLRAGTLVDSDTHTVFFRNIEVTSVRFPSLEGSTAEMEQLFRSLIPTGGEPISEERVMADLERSKPEAQQVAVNNEPPRIFYSSSPALLLIVEGDPVLAPVEKTDLQFLVNTNWDVFFEKSKKSYYLLADRIWLTAQDLTGPWTGTETLPKDMAKLPAGQHFDDVKKMVPPPPPSGAAPHVFFSNVPAELILVKGSPVYSRIPGTSLLYATNTDSDLFVNDLQQQYYVLLSGRWFRARALDGPWSYAGDALPPDFAKIPPNTPKAHVLASVPGTIEASDAVMLAQIPTTAIVNRAEAEAKVRVSYDGPPQFKPIEKTSLQYAVNTQEKVIKAGDIYYLCFQGVWFMSTTPDGPWKTADSVPKEIYTIPPSSPVYNVTYVTQANPTITTVESSTTAGYFGMFVIGMAAGAAIAYGTGYYYPSYVYWGPGIAYPIYRPWPGTYGAGFAYSTWTGGFVAGRAAYGPYGAARSAAWYNPATGTYGRAATAQGRYGGRTVEGGYNPWTGGRWATSQGHNVYGQWGHSAAVRGNQWVQSGRVTTARGTGAGFQTSSGQAGVSFHGNNGTIATTTNGLYAGRDDNVYRKNSDGSWSEYTKGGGWNTVDASAAKQQAQDKIQDARQQPAHNLRGGSETARPLGSASMAGRTGSQQTIPSSTLQGLNSSAWARQRGQSQSQRFRHFRRGRR